MFVYKIALALIEFIVARLAKASYAKGEKSLALDISADTLRDLAAEGRVNKRKADTLASKLNALVGE